MLSSGPIEPPSDEEEPPARAKKPKKSKTVTTEEKPAAVKEKKAKVCTISSIEFASCARTDETLNSLQAARSRKGHLMRRPTK